MSFATIYNDFSKKSVRDQLPVGLVPLAKKTIFQLWESCKEKKPDDISNERSIQQAFNQVIPFLLNQLGDKMKYHAQPQLTNPHKVPDGASYSSFDRKAYLGEYHFSN